MHIEIGSYLVRSESDIERTITSEAFQMQIGASRIGAGGRVMPRNPKGRVVNLANLVASTVEVIETEIRPVARKVVKVAVHARAVVSLALLVVVQTVKASVQDAVAALTRSIRRILGSKEVGNLALAAAGFGLLMLHPVFNGFVHAMIHAVSK